MKLLITAVLSVFCLSAFAQSFIANDSLSTRTPNYNLKKTIDIDVISYSPYSQTLLLKLNGSITPTVVRNISIEHDEIKGVVTLFNDVLQDGYSCEESESVKYLAYVSIEIDRDPHSEADISIEKVNAKYSYSYDMWHDMDPEVKVIKYTRQ